MPKLSTEISAFDYNMSHPKRGKLLLFNQRDFDPKLRLNSRSGTDVDRNNLTLLFERLGFDVTSYDNVNYWNLKKHLTAGNYSTFSKYNSYVKLVMISHVIGERFARFPPLCQKHLSFDIRYNFGTHTGRVRAVSRTTLVEMNETVRTSTAYDCRTRHVGK